MTARQSYHLTFARFSPSLSVKSFTASEAANTAYRVEITATSTDSSLPLSSYLNQRAAFEIRPQEAVLSEVAAAFAAGSDDPPTKQWQGIITSCEKLSVSKDETDNKQSEESADNTVLLGKQQHWGLHPKTPDEAEVQTTLLNEAVLCRQTEKP